MHLPVGLDRAWRPVFFGLWPVVLWRVSEFASGILRSLRARMAPTRRYERDA
ncbi:hypothetical protein [Phycobacter azelaicus]|uniref:hypothetical protein n=1 Tax=Phycobacter azelaicus TaxID=2668075 RepID=UPI001D00E94E|nr:hypothetical protein [Phycobacter azelaicus]